MKLRREVCQNSKTVPQAAILHSVHYIYAHAKVPFLFWEHYARPVEAAATVQLGYRNVFKDEYLQGYGGFFA